MDKKTERWERLRSKGKCHFVVRYGVIYWGIPTGFLWSVFFSTVNSHVSFWSALPVGMCLFPLGGIFFGLVMWAIGEKNYKKVMASDGTAESD